MLYDGLGRPLDRNGNPFYPGLPLATYFAAAGISETDSIHLEREIRHRAKLRVIAKANTDEPDARRRYLSDPQYRIGVNQQIIGELILDMGFSGRELSVIDQGLGLGLAANVKQPARARVMGVDGREEVFDVEELDDLGPGGAPRMRLTDARTGEIKIV